MAIIWSSRQTAECQYFVSLEGFDTPASWNAFLLANGLPQDCTSANIGNAVYPFRTFAAVAADVRTATGNKIGVGLGRWGSDVQRATFSKSFYWLGQAGTVVDLQLCTAVPFRALAVAETIDFVRTVNSEFRNLYSFVAGSINCIRCCFDRFVYISGYAYLTYCFSKYVTPPSGSGASFLVLNNCTILSGPSSFGAYALNSIVPAGSAQFSHFYYCLLKDGVGNRFGCITGSANYNNETAKDYTLASTSPCLYAGKNNANIGCYGEAVRVDPNNSAFSEPAAVYSRTLGVNDLYKSAYDIGGITYYQFLRTVGITAGNVRSGWINLGTIRRINAVRLVHDVFFNATTGKYSVAASDSLSQMRIGLYVAKTEQEKAGAAIIWVDHDTAGVDLDALFISLHVYITGDSPAV